MTFDGFDVVVTPFPFADRGVQRKRPALVLSCLEDFGNATGVAIIAMITTGRASQWPFDVPIGDLEAAGLRHPCVVRMKLATVSFARIGPKIGRLAEPDARAVAESLGRMLPIAAGHAGEIEYSRAGYPQPGSAKKGVSDACPTRELPPAVR